MERKSSAARGKRYLDSKHIVRPTKIAAIAEQPPLNENDTQFTLLRPEGEKSGLKRNSTQAT